jgi:hypothetical protein
MENRILDIQVEDRSLDPISAEVWITVRPEHLTPTTEVRGRLMGPSCPYASTVEIAYPLQLLRRPEQLSPGAMRYRVVIPEASLWDPQSPFLYGGPVELWQDGRLAEKRLVRHGLRHIIIGPRGLRINGKATRLEGRVLDHLDEATAVDLRQQGVNLLLVPPSEQNRPIWNDAERRGFLILAHINPDDAHHIELLQVVRTRASYLASVAGTERLESESGLILLPDASGYRIVAGEVELGRVSL